MELTQAIAPRPTTTGLSRFRVGSRKGRRLLARSKSRSRTPCETHWNVPHSGNTRRIRPRMSSWSALNQQKDDMTAPDPNTQAGQRFQEKFEFYLVALAFAILGLAAQTAEFGNFVWADLAELAAWGALLLSGLTGVARLEDIPHIYKLLGLKSERLGVLTHLKRNPDIDETEFLNETLSRSAAISQIRGNITQIEDAIKPVEAKLVHKATIQRRALSFGVTMLVVARGILPVLTILDQIGS